MNVGAAFSAVPMLAGLSEGSRARLMAYAHVRVLARGEAAFRDGQAATELAYLVKGKLKLARAGEHGREAILNLVDEGDVLCTSAPMSWVPYCCDAVALEDETVILSVPRRDVYAVLDSDPSAARVFFEAAGCRAASLCERVQQLSSGQVVQRIASLFVTLGKRAGKETPEGLALDIPLTRQDIADLSATTVETAIRTLSRLAKANLMSGEKGGFVIQDLPALEAVARGTREV